MTLYLRVLEQWCIDACSFYIHRQKRIYTHRLALIILFYRVIYLIFFSYIFL